MKVIGHRTYNRGKFTRPGSMPARQGGVALRTALIRLHFAFGVKCSPRRHCAQRSKRLLSSGPAIRHRSRCRDSRCRFRATHVYATSRNGRGMTTSQDTRRQGNRSWLQICTIASEHVARVGPAIRAMLSRVSGRTPKGARSRRAASDWWGANRKTPRGSCRRTKATHARQR